MHHLLYLFHCTNVLFHRAWVKVPTYTHRHVCRLTRALDRNRLVISRRSRFWTALRPWWTDATYDSWWWSVATLGVGAAPRHLVMHPRSMGTTNYAPFRLCDGWCWWCSLTGDQPPTVAPVLGHLGTAYWKGTLSLSTALLWRDWNAFTRVVATRN